MTHDDARPWRPLLTLLLAVLLAACGAPTPTTTPPPAVPTAKAATAAPAATPAATPTATPTAAPAVEPATEPPPAADRCSGLAGTLEVQVLVGPAEAVGLEPVSVGQVPFAVTADGPPYLVEGQAPVAYEAVLEEEWGTYTVSMDLELAVSGECRGEAGGEQLDLVLEMAGEQLVVVEAESFQGEYPWEGSRSLDLSLPVEEGATAEGEGWAVVLHPASP